MNCALIWYFEKQMKTVWGLQVINKLNTTIIIIIIIITAYLFITCN